MRRKTFTSREAAVAAMRAEDEAHDKAMRERRRWRDGRKVVHEMRPVEAVNLQTGERSIRGWVPSCGKRYVGTVAYDPTLPVTCIGCVARMVRDP